MDDYVKLLEQRVELLQEKVSKLDDSTPSWVAVDDIHYFMSEHIIYASLEETSYKKSKTYNAVFNTFKSTGSVLQIEVTDNPLESLSAIQRAKNKVEELINCGHVVTRHDPRVIF